MEVYYIYIYMYIYICIYICIYIYMSTLPVCHCKFCTILLHIEPVSLGQTFGWVWGRPGLRDVHDKV